MALRTASIFSERRAEDGVRIHTAGRLTLDDGKTTDPWIEQGVGFDLWWPELAPEGSVYWDWHKQRITWERFGELYIKKLESDAEAVAKVKELAAMALGGEVTAMCLEREPHFCHRQLLGNHVGRLFPDVEVIIG